MRALGQKGGALACASSQVFPFCGWITFPAANKVLPSGDHPKSLALGIPSFPIPALLELLRRFRRVLRLDYEELAFEYFPREVPSDGDGKLLAIRRKLQEL